LDGGWSDGNSTAIGGLMAGTAMDDATVTQQRCDRRLDGRDSNGRCNGDSTAMDGGWQWMAFDGMMVTQRLWTQR